MKNIVRIPEDKIKVLTSCDRFPVNGYFTFDKKDAEIEQVPENFADLQELCQDLKGLCKNYNIEVFDDAIFVLDSKLVLLKVYDDGEIKDSGSEVIAENRTPQQMWNIIKNLIGE